MKHLLAIRDLNQKEILEIISKAKDIKKNPNKYSQKLKQKTMLMIFAKPSLRTRVSFETGMTQMGGHAIYYDIATSPIGKGESISDTAQTSSRYVDIIMARLFEHEDIEELAKYSTVPVINALTNFSHPCQILGDLMTIQEHKKKIKGLKLVYLGDANNNVTHSLMYGCSRTGIEMVVSCPSKTEYMPDKKVLQDTKVKIISDPRTAVKDADIIYTDTWMSYHVPDSEKERRISDLKRYQVNSNLMSIAKKALFMHCLPAKRGYEVTNEVIDSKRSIVFDQAENRLHIQKSIILKLLKKI